MSNAADSRDYFTDLSLLTDPYSYLATIREQGRVYYNPDRDLYYITGFEEAIEVLRNHDDFASVISAGGPVVPLPFEPKGDDISDQIEEHRSEILGSDMVAAYDGERHGALRGLISRIFTPVRLKENEEYIDRLADEIATDMASKGRSEVISEVATPYVTLVIADLLGVPQEDMDAFRDAIDAGPPPFDMTAVDAGMPEPSQFMITCGTFFFNYVTERRANPRDDIMTELANAKLPDGSVPDDIEVVKMMMFLFGAGQDTTAKLLGNAIRYLAENPDMQAQLREDRSKVNPFVEEMLRSEGSVKATFRLARRNSSIGGVDIPAGKRVVIFLAGANRDPIRWDSPDEFRLERERHSRHVAFGQGLHTCIGAPLARTEVRVILNKILDKTSDFKLSDAHHGSASNRKIDFETSYVIRGLANLHVEFSAA